MKLNNISVINQLNKSNKWCLTFTMLILCICSFSVANASENNSPFDSANSEYSKGNYENAVKLYESILNKGEEAPELYFNLGNAYYKSNNIALAILNYERAKKLDPDNEDITVNLKFANQKIEDKIDAAPQLFLSEWKNDLLQQMTEKGWSITCILSIVISLVLLVIYFSTNNRILKQIGFFGGLLLMLSSILLFFVAKEKYNLTKRSDFAIVTSASVTANGSPNEKGTKLFILHEGTKVKIVQEDEDWMEIKIINGNVGWVKSKDLTSI